MVSFHIFVFLMNNSELFHNKRRSLYFYSKISSKLDSL